MMDTVPSVIFLILSAAFGGIIGSFLNVCIYRLPLQKSVVWPASACPHCARELSWYENVPVISFLVLRGRCRTCATTIGWRYPIIEALTVVMFAAAWWYYGPGVLLASRLVLGCLLIVLFAIDLEHQLLPHKITVSGIVVGFVFNLSVEPGRFSSLLGIVLGGGLLYGIGEAWSRLRHVDALGGGDPPMLAMVGAFLGWKMVILTLMLGSLLGSLIGVGLIVARRGSLASKLPFGCFLALGAAAAATVGPDLLAWYLGWLA
jgi:leader peptidase (prepilin peptidase)/N-methyltransferase